MIDALLQWDEMGRRLDDLLDSGKQPSHIVMSTERWRSMFDYFEGVASSGDGVRSEFRGVRVILNHDADGVAIVYDGGQTKY